MKRCLLILFAACLLLSSRTWASAPVRMAVVPPTFLDGESSKEGVTLADYLQIKLHGLPDVGRDEPQRFARRFAVKDFLEVSRALAREILQAALQHGKGAPVPPDGGTVVGRSIFARLCALVNDGYFSTDPNLEKILPSHPHVVERPGQVILKPLQRPPFAAQRTAYCRRMLELACFFDPENDRVQLLRWAAEASNVDSAAISLREAEECFELAERVARMGKFDAATFIAAADSMMDYFTHGSWGPPPPWADKVAWASSAARYDAMQEAFVTLLTETLPAVSRELDAAGIPPERRGFLADWLEGILQTSVRPELRLKYLAVARPLTPDPDDASREYDRLMADLGDRKGVQTVLMQPALPPSPPAARPASPNGQTTDHLPNAGLAPGRGSFPSSDGDEPLLAGIASTPLPRPRGITLPMETLLATAAGPGAPAHLARPPGFGMNGPFSRGHSIIRIDGYGDQLILDLSGGVHLRYQTSCDTAHIFEGADSDVICGDMGRALYRRGDALAWTDLVSSASGVFSPEEGAPAAAPAMLGFDAAGWVVAVNDAAKTVGLYDWSKHRWLTLLAPPPALAPAPLSAARPYARDAWGATTATVWGSGDDILFPLWNLLFDQATQKWRPLPSEACLPPLIMPQTFSEGHVRAVLGGPGGSVCVRDHLWSWNASGITDFSLAEGKVAWHTDSHRVAGACADGPYLWVLLGRGFAEVPALVLLDRSVHTVSGMMPLPVGITAIRVDDAHAWLGSAGRLRGPRSPSGDANLLCVDKARIYAALHLDAPTKQDRPRRPDAFEEGGSALYAAILREDPSVVRRLLEGGASADGAFGPGKASALTVAAWTGNEAVCRLLIEHGAAVNPARPENGKGWTPLETAAARGDLTILQMLLQSKAAPTAAALAAALRADDFAAAELLRKAGAPTGQLADIVVSEQNEAMARRLLASDLPLSSEDRARLSLLAKDTDATLPPGVGAAQVAALITQALKEKQAEQAAKLVGMVPVDQLRDKAMGQVLLTPSTAGSRGRWMLSSTVAIPPARRATKTVRNWENCCSMRHNIPTNFLPCSGTGQILAPRGRCRRRWRSAWHPRPAR